MDATRRRFILGAAALLCAPTIVRAASLMPVHKIDALTLDTAYGAGRDYTTLAQWCDYINIESCSVVWEMGLVHGKWTGVRSRPGYLTAA